MKKDIDSGAGHSVMRTAAVPEQKPRNRTALVALAGVAVILLAFIAAKIGGLFTPESAVPRLTNPSQITSAMGVEDFPTWSPDGGRLAYASNQSGNWDIYVAQVSGGQQVNLTADHAGHDRFPGWSPDGSQIAFWSERDDGGYFVMSALGGPVRKILSSGGGKPTWSADGTQLACVVGDSTGSFIKIISLRGADSQQLRLPERVGTPLELSWSPDDRYFAFVRATGETPDIAQLWVLRLVDGECFPVTDGRRDDRSPGWSPDGNILYFVSDRGGSKDLWMQRMSDNGEPQGLARSVTTGIGIRHAVFSRDGARLAYSKGRLVANLWQIPILQERPATWADARQITFDQAFIEMVDVAPDGKNLLFNSDRGGNLDLWLMQVEGGDMQQITLDPAPDWSPAWSPDGKQIAFYSARSGNRDIWVMPTGGGQARQLTRNETADWFPAWSPDGLTIAFASRRSGNQDVWVIPAMGGEAKQVTTHPGEDTLPQWSSDGKWLLVTSNRSGEGFGLWQVPTSEGNSMLLTSAHAYQSRFSRDGEQIYFMEREGGRKIWVIAVEGGSARLMAKFDGRRGRLAQQALATDGEHLYFSWQQDIGDIWVMDVE